MGPSNMGNPVYSYILLTYLVGRYNLLQVLASAKIRRHISLSWSHPYERHGPIQFNFFTLRLYKFMLLPAEQASLFSLLLAVLLANGSSCSWHQCGLVSFSSIAACLHSSSNHVDFCCLRSEASCSVQVVRNVLAHRIDIFIWRSIEKEFRKPSGDRFSWWKSVMKISRYRRHICGFHWSGVSRGSSLKSWEVVLPFEFATALKGVSIVLRLHHGEGHNACRVVVIVAYDMRLDEGP